MKKKIFNTLWVVGVLTFAGFCLPACHRELDVQKAYPFKVETMPIAKELTQGQTAEIRCSLRPSGQFQDTQYTLRFFQYYGKGALRITPTSKPLLPNDRYPMAREEFRLYYISQSTDRQTIDRRYFPIISVWVACLATANKAKASCFARLNKGIGISTRNTCPFATIKVRSCVGYLDAEKQSLLCVYIRE